MAGCRAYLVFLVVMCVSVGLYAGERIAVLPFVEAGEEAGGRALVTQELYQQLGKSKFDLIAEDSVAGALRQLRLRNTASLIEVEAVQLASLLSADYLLAGTIYRFRTDTVLSEACVCARLLRISDLEVVWSSCTAHAAGGSQSLVSTRAIRGEARQARKIVRRLLADFALAPAKQRTEISAVSFGRQHTTFDCETIAVIPPSDETEYSHGSEMIGDILTTALRRRGFQVADRGRVREAMLEARDLRNGQSARDISRLIKERVGADILLTGSISELTGVRDASLGGVPAIALELRWIDPATDLVLWSHMIERRGDQGKGVFDLGIVHSPAQLAQIVVDDFVSDLRVVRRRVENTQDN